MYSLMSAFPVKSITNMGACRPSRLKTPCLRGLPEPVPRRRIFQYYRHRWQWRHAKVSDDPGSQKCLVQPRARSSVLAWSIPTDRRVVDNSVRIRCDTVPSPSVTVPVKLDCSQGHAARVVTSTPGYVGDRLAASTFVLGVTSIVYREKSLGPQHPVSQSSRSEETKVGGGFVTVTADRQSLSVYSFMSSPSLPTTNILAPSFENATALW